MEDCLEEVEKVSMEADEELGHYKDFKPTVGRKN